MPVIQVIVKMFKVFLGKFMFSHYLLTMGKIYTREQPAQPIYSGNQSSVA
jgi:hypothetical protein